MLALAQTTLQLLVSSCVIGAALGLEGGMLGTSGAGECMLLALQPLSGALAGGALGGWVGGALTESCRSLGET